MRPGLTALILVVTAGALYGCGQRGPLYLDGAAASEPAKTAPADRANTRPDVR